MYMIKENDMSRIAIAVLAALITIILYSTITSNKAYPHEWYSYECCNDNDCGPVLSKEDTGHGTWIITSKKGMVLVPYDFPKLPSQDDQEHICLFFDGIRLVVRCYYVPVGT